MLHDEAHPDLGEPVRQFIARYLDAEETVLIPLGQPGSGALLRPGRCFATLRTRSLLRGEGAKLVRRLCGSDAAREEAALAALYKDGARSVSVAAIYRACAYGIDL